jgi:cAMP phosphodiesterase
LFIIYLAFDRVSYAIRQLCNITQQARAAFQYATLNVFQTSSRQQQVQSQRSTPMILAQLQAIQQQKSSSIHRPNSSIHKTP